MSVILIIGLFWGLSSLCKAGRQARAQRRAIKAQHALAIRRAQEAARAAQMREVYRQQQLAAREVWKQQQLAAKAETARLISEERARMDLERARAKAEAQAQREAEQAAREAQKAQKAAEKAAKAAMEREQAQADMEHYEALRQGYMDLYDLLQEEMKDSSTTVKRRATIQRQLLGLEEKLHKIDTKRAKAYYLVKGAC